MAQHRKPRRHRNRGRHRKPVDIRTSLRPAAVAAVATAAVVGLPAWPAAAAVSAVNWDPIIACESGGDPGAANPASTASGLYQFLDSTWVALGGAAYSPRAKGATPAQQLVIANRAYAQSGFAPWAASRACWASRVGPTAPAPASNTFRGGREGSSPARVAGRPRSPAINPTASDNRARVATAFALARVGSLYAPSWRGAAAGRSGLSLDGSELTAAAYAAAGITLPATAAIQYDRSPRVRAGTQLLPGDLVFYGTPSAIRQTGIYIGNGNMVYATASDQPVRMTTYRRPGDDYVGAARPTTARSAPQGALSAVARQTGSPLTATAQSRRPAVGVHTPPPPSVVSVVVGALPSPQPAGGSPHGRHSRAEPRDLGSSVRRGLPTSDPAVRLTTPPSHSCRGGRPPSESRSAGEGGDARIAADRRSES